MCVHSVRVMDCHLAATIRSSGNEWAWPSAGRQATAVDRRKALGFANVREFQGRRRRIRGHREQRGAARRSARGSGPRSPPGTRCLTPRHRRSAHASPWINVTGTHTQFPPYSIFTRPFSVCALFSGSLHTFPFFKINPLHPKVFGVFSLREIERIFPLETRNFKLWNMPK